jgi:hypothetical protein
LKTPTAAAAVFEKIRFPKKWQKMEEKRKGKKNEKTKRGLVKMTSIVLSSFVISLFNKPHGQATRTTRTRTTEW